MQEINLYDLIKHYASKWRFIVLLSLAGLACGLIYTIFIQTPLYHSTAKLVLISSSTTQTANDQTVRINDYINLMQSRRVLQPVADKKQTGMSFEQLTRSVKATNQKNTGVIDVTVSAPSGEQSKNIANSITTSFKKVISQLYANDNVSIVDEAVQADKPFNVNVPLQLGIAGIVGLLAAIIRAFFTYDIRRPKVVKSIVKKKKRTMTKTKNPINSRKK